MNIPPNDNSSFNENNNEVSVSSNLKINDSSIYLLDKILTEHQEQGKLSDKISPVRPLRQCVKIAEPIIDDEVELTKAQCQKLNYTKKKIQLEVYKDYLKNKESLRNRIECDQYEESKKIHSPIIGIDESENEFIAETGNNHSSNVSLNKLFIKDFSIFAYFSHDARKTYDYYIWDNTFHHHIKTNTSNLRREYVKFIARHSSITTVNTKVYFDSFIQSIPLLDDSNIKPLPSNCVMFNNGFLNVEKFTFTPLNNDNIKNYYSPFCIDLSYDENVPTPIAFNQLLKSISHDNPRIETLICEQFGSALCQNSPVKNIFLFQGCTNAGKTRLINILAKLTHEKDVIELNTISDITDDKLFNLPYSIRFIHVKELGEAPLPDKAVSLLKGIADGSISNLNNPVKIFMCTNHALITRADGHIDQALKERISTIPFKQAMKNDTPMVANFEKNYLQSERLGIIVQCLKAYNKVLNNNNRFSSNLDNLNRCVHNKPDDILSPAELERMKQIKAPSKSSSKKVVHVMKLIFHLTAKPNPSMTTTAITEIINSIITDGTGINDPSWVGRYLADCFGKDKIRHNRDGDGPLYYNVELNENYLDGVNKSL